MQLTCYALSLAGFEYNCCTSCHDDDEDYGYAMLEQYPDYEIKGRKKKSKVWAHVCCCAPKLETVEDWAKVVWAYRKYINGQ